ALPTLQRWADETHHSIINSSGFWEGVRRRFLMDWPPHWKWWSCPFRVTVRTEAGPIEEGWVLCHRVGRLAPWESGRVSEIKWSESKKPSDEVAPTGLCDPQLDSRLEQRGM